MPSAFESKFLGRVVPAMNRWFGVSVTLSQGALTSESFTARRHDQDQRSMGQEYGFDVRYVMRTFVFAVADCVIGGDPVEPKIGDKITEVDSGEVYEIMPPGENEPAVEPHLSGSEWRVQARRILDAEY